MSKYSRRDFLKLAGASVAVAVSGEALAEENPFGFKEMDGGYKQVADNQGNCGANMKKSTGNCGANMKSGQGNCGAKMKKSTGNCGANMKGGQGNCGANMKKQQKQSGEGKCGGGNMMK